MKNIKDKLFIMIYSVMFCIEDALYNFDGVLMKNSFNSQKTPCLIGRTGVSELSFRWQARNSVRLLDLPKVSGKN